MCCKNPFPGCGIAAIVLLATWLAAGPAGAVEPGSSERIALSAGPAVVRVACGWSAEWEWQGQAVARRGIESGTGFFVRPDGYILTGARVVVGLKESDEHVRTAAGIDVLESILEAAGRPSTTEDVRVLMVRMALGEIPEPRLVRLQRVRYVYLQDGRRFPFTIRSFGAPSDCRSGRARSATDAAVLKIEIENAPTLAPGDPDLPGTGLPIRIVTLPEMGQAEDLEPKSAPFETSLVEDSISAQEVSPDGQPILTTAAGTLPAAGSGGPVLDERGRVVGLLAACRPAAGGGAGFHFVVPIRTALGLVRRAGAEAEAGPTDGPWRDGLAAYWSEDYGTARQKFAEVAGLFPGHAEARRLATECDERLARGGGGVPGATPSAGGGTAGGTVGGTVAGPPAGAGPGKTAGKPEDGLGTGAIAGIVGGGAVLLVLVVVIVAVAVRRKPVPAAGAYPVPGAPTVARTEQAPAPSVPRLVCSAGPLAGREFPIGQGIMVGREAAQAQVVVPDTQVSSGHVWVGPAGGRIVARDQGSTNGTFLNGRMDQRVAEVMLGEGDTLILGARGTVKFVFRA